MQVKSVSLFTDPNLHPTAGRGYSAPQTRIEVLPCSPTLISTLENVTWPRQARMRVIPCSLTRIFTLGVVIWPPSQNESNSLFADPNLQVILGHLCPEMQVNEIQCSL